MSAEIKEDDRAKEPQNKLESRQQAALRAGFTANRLPRRSKFNYELNLQPRM